jgi:hypothetical protein
MKEEPIILLSLLVTMPDGEQFQYSQEVFFNFLLLSRFPEIPLNAAIERTRDKIVEIILTRINLYKLT